MGIDQMKHHSVQPGYLKNLPKPIRTKAAQNREKIRGLPRIIGRQKEEHNDSAVHLIIILRSSGATNQPTITGQWYSGTTTQSATTFKSSIGPFRHDDSAGRSKRAKEFSSQRNQAQYVCVNAEQAHA
ncbi:mitochondrial phosphate carrier protein 1, mitochondrial [Dorcoceras hygrometricum]|uniref:Mitochondrial phosphate carrier protein 1, mitochondrial n=1 Tax=Dorcoceras hygrometricum TaxID=472368 RepID=A0A2Z6ZTB0_9LAMI|nr:mitochondrial phosphate carrier protein 1, mitochondrial [Dorcoceras hygrometricum]